MRKLLLLLAVFTLPLAGLYAQKAVTGTVTDESGDPIQGVAVVVKGTTIGAYTNAEGAYQLEAPEDASTLLFTFIGKRTEERAIDGSTIDVSLIASDVTLDEVVVTALGIKREERSLGYAVQEVSGESVNMVGDQNLVSALAGKAAGIQVISASGASLGGSANIRIRGANGLTGGSPLFVVDGTPISNANFSASYRGGDFGNLAQDINLDDVESISVLKGPAASALYGNRASNGVIVVTTKKGNNRRGIGISINSSLTFDEVYILPNYQNEYGGGYTQDFLETVDPIDGQTYKTLNYAADESWGPKIDGTQYRPWWSWYPGTPEYGTTIPMTSNPNNVRDFFETGMSVINSVALSGGNDNASIRLTYKNTHQTGVIPNSRLDRNNLGINAQTKLTEKLTANASLNYISTQGRARPEFGYVGNNPVLSFNQWFQRQLDIDRLRDYRNDDGTFRSWNIRSATNLRPLYWDSPFFSAMENFSTDSRERYFGNIGLKYDLTDNLTVSGFLRTDQYTMRIENRTASGGLDQDSYSESVRNGREDNYELLAQYNNDFGPISLNVNLGGNIRLNNYRSNFMGTVGGLNAPNLFNISASTDRPNVNSFIARKVVRSVYGGATLGVNDIVYLDFTLRNDWSSALPQDNNSYLYPSAALSFVFSELWGQSDFFSYGKLRVNFAQVGSDIADFSRDFNPYQTTLAYNRGTPYGSTAAFFLPATLPNEDLRPALSSAYEIGMDLRFFNERVNLDVTYYKTINKDQILTLDVPGSSGYSAAIINAGRIESEGFEIALGVKPIQTRDFSWEFTFNAATNTSTVVELAEGLDNRRLDGWGWGGFSINAEVGEEWGMMRGTAFARDDNGNRLVDENGFYVTERNQNLGNLLPDWTGGFRNVIRFKGLELTGFIEYQKGGQFHSVTRMFNAYSGLGQETVGNNANGVPLRDPVDQGGGVLADGVFADGTPNDVLVEAQTFYGSLFALHENWIYDASYIKLREVRLGYQFPRAMFEKLPINNMTLSLIGRNLLLIHSNVDGIDPSEISPGSNNYVFQENGILPGVRSLGVNLQLGF